MLLNPHQANALQTFCDTILCGHNEAVFHRCKAYMENASDENDGIESGLYVLYGSDIDPDDPYRNVADADKQLVKPQFYLVSSDAGAPALEDFFWYVENIKSARELSFSVEKGNFSDDNSIVEWLAELSQQLEGLYIVNFDGGSEDYHFTIMGKSDCERAMEAFKNLTAHIHGYTYTSFLITEAFME